MAGDDDFPKQVPLKRAVPLWGGCSTNGFAVVLFHDRKKLTTAEWVTAVDAGKLTAAIKQLKPALKRGPWRVICDNEGFLQAADATRAHKKASVRLWRIPARSPDLNPVERFWAWLRRTLRAKDLADAMAKRPVLEKAAYIARVRRVLQTQRAQKCAANCAKSLRKVCRVVIEKRGAASSG